MIDRHCLGVVPPKPHTAYRTPAGSLLQEHLFTRGGFSGPFTYFYHRYPLTAAHEPRVSTRGWLPPEPQPEGGVPLRRRLYDVNEAWRLLGATPPLSGMSVDSRWPLLFNDEVVFLAARLTATDDVIFANGDGDELWFVRTGRGRLESLCGWLDVTSGDYVWVPRSLPHRWHVAPGDHIEALCMEMRNDCEIPPHFRNAVGQLTLDAPYTHRDFRRPEGPIASLDAAVQGPCELLVKKGDRFTALTSAQALMDVVGWDGWVYPVAFPIRAYQPKTGQIHLPPTVHTTFTGPGYVVCSFVPRLTDYHPHAIPCPYPHSNVHCDEVILYLEGNFTSRRGVGSGCLSLHPAGLAHGPHPGAYEASIGSVRTDELAVMVDTLRPLHVTAHALAIENASYHASWSTPGPNP